MKQPAIGPGALITSAFIGPGTVTVCTLAGVDYGYSLLWVMVLATGVCYLLQEMAARLGLVTGHGLPEALRSQISSPFLRALVIATVLSAIVIGNAAYEAGNISGGALGLQELLGFGALQAAGFSVYPATLLTATLAFLLLLSGSYRLLERTLLGLVLLMSLAFVFVAVATRPAVGSLIQGLVPVMDLSQTLTVIGLIGTTVVPYNLFLHASIVREKWSGQESLYAMRLDTALTIGVGGIISMAVIVSAASMQGAEISSAAQLGRSLEPVFGPASNYILATGLFAAGITSAITAPLAATYVVNGCLGWDGNLKSARSRAVWMTVLLVGLLFSIVGGSPIQVIRFAQVANGVLLPLIVAFLLWAVNKRNLLGNFVNSNTQNLLGVIVLLFVTLLSVRTLWLIT